MNARTRIIVYRIFLCVVGLCAVVGTVVIAANGWEPSNIDHAFVWAFAFAMVFLVLLPVNTLVHELGHLLFGFCAGMKFSSVRFGRIRLVRMGKRVHFRFVTHKDVAGSCEMYPKDERHVRGRMMTYAMGGAIFNLVFGVAFVCTCLIFPPHPALYFFQLFAPLSLLEAAASIFPVETATGKSDGAVVYSLAKRDATAIISLHVLTAQGTLAHHDFNAIERSFLFDLPVVREDETVFLALTQLRWQYCFYMGEEAEALVHLRRLEELYAYLPEMNCGDVACDLLYAYSALEKDEKKAESYLADAAFAKGSCAYFRAMSAYCAVCGRESEREQFLSHAQAAVEQEPMKGLAALERLYISKII